MAKTLKTSKKPDREAYLRALGEYYCRSRGGQTYGISSPSKEKLKQQENK